MRSGSSGRRRRLWRQTPTKTFAITVAQAVASAHKEGGFLGIGGKQITNRKPSARRNLHCLRAASGSPNPASWSRPSACLQTAPPVLAKRSERGHVGHFGLTTATSLTVSSLRRAHQRTLACFLVCADARSRTNAWSAAVQRGARILPPMGRALAPGAAAATSSLLSAASRTGSCGWLCLCQAAAGAGWIVASAWCSIRGANGAGWGGTSSSRPAV